MDEADFRTCLGLARDSGSTGTYMLIFSGPGDEWAGLAPDGRDGAGMRLMPR